jgi:hypothetical protein
MSRHSFDPEIAGRVGLNAAVIFQNITFWIEKNQANRRNLRDGRYWTYNSISAFGELFPYLSEKQIRTALEKLVSAELIIKGNFRDDRYDRTCWYALGNSICPIGQIDPTERENPIRTDINHIKNQILRTRRRRWRMKFQKRFCPPIPRIAFAAKRFASHRSAKRWPMVLGASWGGFTGWG